MAKKNKKRIERQSFYLPQFDNKSCENKILELQINIYNGAKEGNKSIVKLNQKHLVKSKEACYLAVKKVCTNQGGTTSGVDGFIPKTTEDYESLIEQLYVLKPHNYKAKPLKRFWIPKAPPSKDKRPLSIPTIFDRGVQSLYALSLDPVNEAYSDSHNYGFRKGRSAADAMAYIRTALVKQDASEYILEVDIKKCFDSIDHKYILENIPVNTKILKQWLICGVMDANAYYRDENGVPQGGIISPIICNLVLNGFEELALAKEQINIWYKYKQISEEETSFFIFCRYADDMVLIAKTEHLLHKLNNLLKQFLSIRGLSINENKTKYTYILEGFKFFFKRFDYQNPKIIKIKKYGKKESRKGFYVKKGNILISPPKESVKKTLEKISTEAFKCQTEQGLYYSLGSIIRGWCNYYRSCNLSDQKSDLDHYTYLILNSWARKRFKLSNKDSYLKYFTNYKIMPLKPELPSRSKRKSKVDTLKLHLPGYFNKTTYRLINKYYNPYNYRSGYYEHLERKIKSNLTEKLQKGLIEKSRGCCSNCGTLLIEDTFNAGYEIHHIRPREFGGSNDKSNLTLLCKPCHKYITGVQKSRNLNEAMLLKNKGVLTIPPIYLKEFQLKPFEEKEAITIENIGDNTELESSLSFESLYSTEEILE